MRAANSAAVVNEGSHEWKAHVHSAEQSPGRNHLRTAKHAGYGGRISIPQTNPAIKGNLFLKINMLAD
jgi:hypothetical protein